jgi:radical SAM superfamily enzyme YgiQ (UPF0313 family)
MTDTTPQILYIHAAKQPVGFPFTDPRFAYLTPFTLFPMGVIGLLNLLQNEGLTVRGMNYPAESFITPGFDLAAWLRGVGAPRLILIDLHWYEHAFGALDVARLCKTVLPHTPVALGGLTATLFAREILEDYPGPDYVIRGDAEEPLRQLAVALCAGRVRPEDLSAIPNLTWRRKGDVVENPQSYQTTSEEMEGLNLYDMSFLDHSDTYLGMEYVGRKSLFYPDEPPRERAHWLSLGRGCLHDCSYCGGGRQSHESISGRRQVLLRSPERVADDLEALHDRGVDQAALSLDPAMLGETYWKALFGELDRRKVRIGIYQEAFQLPGEDYVAALAECADIRHSQIALSPLSGDEHVRALNGKPYTNHALFTLVRALRRHKFPLAVYYSFNLPGQDESALRKTIFVTQRMAQAYGTRSLMVYNQPHTLDPCSPMGRHPETYGINIALRTFQDYFDYCRLTAVERPGVLGSGQRGFTWEGRPPEMERKMQAMWASFARTQNYMCF